MKVIISFVMQFFEMKELSYDACTRKDENGREVFPGFVNKLKAIFYPPGYYPGQKLQWSFFWKRKVDPAEGVPEVGQLYVWCLTLDLRRINWNRCVGYSQIEMTCVQWKLWQMKMKTRRIFLANEGGWETIRSQSVVWTKVYCSAQFLVMLAVYGICSDNRHLSMPYAEFFIYMTFIVFTMLSLGAFFDKKFVNKILYSIIFDYLCHTW